MHNKSKLVGFLAGGSIFIYVSYSTIEAIEKERDRERKKIEKKRQDLLSGCKPLGCQLTLPASQKRVSACT